MSLLLTLLVAFTLTSCGGDNSTGDGTSTNNLSNGVTTGTTGTPGTISNERQFRDNVAAGNFTTATNGLYTRYAYVVYNRTTSSSSNCDTWLIFSYCTYSGSSSYTNYDLAFTRAYNNDGSIYRDSNDTGFSANQITLKSELLKIIDDAIRRDSPLPERRTLGAFAGNKAYWFEPGDGYVYVIDLNKPLAANPTQRLNKTQSTSNSLEYTFYSQY